MDKIKAKPLENTKGAGRPKIEIDLEILKNLASIGCPDYEIASVLNISARTLKRNYAEIVDQFREKGKASLRKKMWDKAIKKDNTNMQIWLVLIAHLPFQINEQIISYLDELTHFPYYGVADTMG
jgi:hypothetical protein